MQILVEFVGTHIALIPILYIVIMYITGKEKLRGRSASVRARGGTADLYKRR